MTDTADTFLGRFRRIVWLIVPAWFVIVSAIRLSALVPTTPGYDGMLYRDATLRWLDGGNPWAIPANGAVFGAPPPTLLAMLPFALVPEPVARISLVLLGVMASVWLIRRLRLPLWWLAFPPLVDGLYIANPHVFVAPLIVAGAGPLAVVTKVYAAPILVLLLRWRALVITASFFVLTAPFLPWTQFIDHWAEINAALASQSRGGLSVTATLWLLPMALVAAALVDRARLLAVHAVVLLIARVARRDAAGGHGPGVAGAWRDDRGDRHRGHRGGSRPSSGSRVTGRTSACAGMTRAAHRCACN